MRKFLSIVIGIALLAAGALTLWLAHGPQRSEARTTGGVLYTQEEFASASVTMESVTETSAGAMSVPINPAISAGAAADLQSMDTEEASAAPMMIQEFDADQQQAIAGTNLTTDVVIKEDTAIEVAPLAAAGSQVLSEGQGGLSTDTSAGYEQRVVELEWPGEFQVGRTGSLRVKLKVLESGALQPIAEVADNEVLATPILITDRYATHNAVVTATISAPDFDIVWVTGPQQPLFKGSTAEWRWTLEADSAQTSIISLALNISWNPKEGQPPGPQNVAIWGQAVQVQVNHVFGLITVPQASILGTALSVLGLIAQFPLLEKMLEILLDGLFSRDRRDSKKRKTETNRRRRR